MFIFLSTWIASMHGEDVCPASGKNSRAQHGRGKLPEVAKAAHDAVEGIASLGRSLGQVIHVVDELVKRKIRFTAIKESIHLEGKQDLQTKVMVALFGLFAEVEGLDLRAHARRIGIRPRQGPTA
jgi:hypothetical protein